MSLRCKLEQTQLFVPIHLLLFKNSQVNCSSFFFSNTDWNTSSLRCTNVCPDEEIVKGKNWGTSKTIHLLPPTKIKRNGVADSVCAAIDRAHRDMLQKMGWEIGSLKTTLRLVILVEIMYNSTVTWKFTNLQLLNHLQIKFAWKLKFGSLRIVAGHRIVRMQRRKGVDEGVKLKSPWIGLKFENFNRLRDGGRVGRYRGSSSPSVRCSSSRNTNYQRQTTEARQVSLGIQNMMKD